MLEHDNDSSRFADQEENSGLRGSYYEILLSRSPYSVVIKKKGEDV